jgi:precorrin-3B C17-methyltransferase / cobalt-factor III methyltransferase
LPSHDKEGLLYIVGTGPGSLKQMTADAVHAIESSEYVIGNASYLTFLAPLIGGKEVIRSAMGKEVERAVQAVELARHHVVAIVSGGDPGVYGMAGIVLEVLEKSGATISVQVVPGLTAANAAASKLGSPLSGDFCVISLSDLLTPLEVIERRLDGAFSMGVPVVLYNPKSRGRPHNFAAAIGIAKKHLPDTTPLAIVKNAYREGEEIIITTLGDATSKEEFVDMHSTVIIGCMESRLWRMGNNVKGIITPRGYHRKYVY